MAKIEIQALHESSGKEEQVVISIPDEDISSNASNIQEFIKDEFKKTHPDHIIMRLSLKADKGIKWQ